MLGGWRGVLASKLASGLDDGDHLAGVAVLLGAAFGVPVCAWWVLWRFYGRVLKSAAGLGRGGYYVTADC